MRFPSNHSPRLQSWIALTVTSCVALIAHASSVKVHSPAKDWVLAACSISLILSFLSTVAHGVVFEPFVGEIPEGVVGVIVFLIWITSLPVSMRPNSEMAVGELGLILNSNLFFFSWASLACIVYLLVHYVFNRGKSNTSTDNTSNTLPEIPTKSLHWLGLFVSSVILMASASDIHNHVSCTSSFFSGTEFCRRTSFAVALGTLGMLFAAIAMFLTQRDISQIAKIEAVLSVFLSIFFIFGVGFVTFGDGPGVILGNIYFSVWIAFSLVLSLGFLSIRDLQQESPQERTQPKPMEGPTEP